MFTTYVLNLRFLCFPPLKKQPPPRCFSFRQGQHIRQAFHQNHIMFRPEDGKQKGGKAPLCCKRVVICIFFFFLAEANNR